MKLYIKLQNGQPIDHPITHDNFVQAFPEIDTNNLPEEFIEFVRVPHPTNIDLYEIYDGVHYEIIDGVIGFGEKKGQRYVSDIWSITEVS